MIAETDRKPRAPLFTKYPLLFLASCFSLGIFLTQFLTFDRRITWLMCMSAAILSGILIRHRVAIVFLCIAFVSAGSLTHVSVVDNVAENRIKRILDEGRIESGEPIEIEGILTAAPEPAYEGLFLTMRTEAIVYKGNRSAASGKVRVFAPIPNDQVAAEFDRLECDYGSKVRAALRIEREERHRNPGVLSRKTLLDQQDLDASATLKSPLLIEMVATDSVILPIGGIYEKRAELINAFRERFDASTAGVLIASLLGNKHFLDKRTADVFREGGTFHILVISGLHITFIGGLILVFARFFTKRKIWQFLAVTVFLWAYTLAVGAEVPVVRASLMFTILLFSQVIYRKGTLLNALGACALVLLVGRPKDLFNPSFHLTFASVAAIVALAFPLIEKFRAIGSWTPTTENPFPPNVPDWLKRFCETLYWRDEAWTIERQRNIWSANLFKSPFLKWIKAGSRQKMLSLVFEGILVSVIVQICLLPFLIIYFHRVSFASVILNLWVGFVIALESFAALFAVFFAYFSDRLAFPLIKLTELLNWLLVAIPAVLLDSAWTNIRVPVYSGWMRAIYVVYFAPILLLAAALNWWNQFRLPRESTNATGNRKVIYASAAITAALAAVIIFHPFSGPKPDGRLHVEFLDVGQGDSALITFPDGTTMLVDGGGRRNLRGEDSDDDAAAFEPDTPRIGEAVVSEFLWEKGYSKIDHLLATHADADHIQGLVDVARNFSITSVFAASSASDDPGFLELSGVLTQNQIPIVELSAGERFEIGGAIVEVLYPSNSAETTTASENDRSVVIRLVYGNRSFLLSGDVELNAERELMKNADALRSDVVKVPHHGSRTSSSQGFVDAASAQYAVFSVGRRSVFGHPHVEVVERWRKAGAKLLKTGDAGTITFSTDGNDLVVSTFVQ